MPCDARCCCRVRGRRCSLLTSALLALVPENSKAIGLEWEAADVMLPLHGKEL
jgi:hypothetical protein